MSRASWITERTIVSESLDVSRSPTNDLSILIAENGMWRNAVSDECPVPKSSIAIGNPFRRSRVSTAAVASGSRIAMLSVISSPMAPAGADMRSSTAAIRSGKSSERRLGPEILMQIWTSNPFSASRR